MAVVTVPFDYDENTHSAVVPICVTDVDDHGKPIDDRLIKKGIVPAAEQLRAIAERILADVYRASEIAEFALHSVWRTYGPNFGDEPHVIILRRARSHAQDLRVGGRRARRKKDVELFELTVNTLRDRFNFAEVLQTEDTIDWLVAELKRSNMSDLAEMVPMMLQECTPEQFMARFGMSRNTLSQRFYRNVRKMIKSAGLY